MKVSSKVAGGAVAALLLAPAATAEAAPGSRQESPLRVQVVCGRNDQRLDIAWRADDPTAYHRVRTDLVNTWAPQADGPGWQAEHVRLAAAGVGPVTVSLLAGEEVVARRTVTVLACDGWQGRAGYEQSGQAAGDAPLAIGPFTGETTVVGGAVVETARDGHLAVAADGTAHVVRGAIDDYWWAHGGPTGRLGLPTGSEARTEDGSGYSTTFTGGTVFWSPATGARTLAVGYPYGVGLDGTTDDPRPGYPTDEGGSVHRGDGSLVGSWQHFEHGVGYQWMLGTGYVFDGPIRDVYAATAYENGRLGWLISSPETFAYGFHAPNDRDSLRQRFEHGAIYAPLNGTVPARVLYGAIAAYYEGNRGPSDFGRVVSMGYPLTDELTTPDGVGRYAHFAGGASVYWSPTSGAHAVDDVGYPFRSYWASRGWEASPLGYPTGERETLGSQNPFGSVGALQRFTGGTAYSHQDSTVAGNVTATVRGAIAQTWSAMGWENSALGYPLSEEFPVVGGVRQTFQGGALTANAATGAVTVTR
ncbi:LGFP repeat-containing protein [Kineococcus sp. GCM10028916]|uniref:LGFP repeat-containing protein n=1 Tax=Kineococcus sp. GCM10028916 TaxID=3273394 RepID=UPI003643182C